MHDTFQRIFENLDPTKFNEAFIHWTNEISTKSQDRIIAIDGKTSRGSHDGDTDPIHIVNAWIE